MELGSLDVVTGLPATSFMEAYILKQMAIFSERHVHFSILLLQVDKLDHFRVTRGPNVIPSILRVVAESIQNSLRPADMVGSWSEFRFLAVLAECKETEVDNVANRIRKMIGRSEIEWWGEKFSVTAAFGGASCRPGDTSVLLMERAESSLMESIAGGGDRVTVVA